MNLVRHRTIPLTLFRIGPKRIKLRDYETQMAKKSRSYDIHIHPDGNVHPMDGVKFTKPNGMSLRPAGINMWDILSSYNSPRSKVTIVPEGAVLPDNLVLLHEHGDHYSLQTTEVCTLDQLNSRITKFLKPFEEIDRETYFTRFPLGEGGPN